MLFVEILTQVMMMAIIAAVVVRIMQ